MPKLFPLHIEVEELAVGRVMRLLNNTPGVAKLHLDLERDKKPVKLNGDGTPRARAVRGTYEGTGDDLIVKVLHGKPPMTRGQLADAFAAQGRAPTSINSVLHKMRGSGEISLSDDGHYTLTKKMRDRLRHRKKR